MRRPGPPIFLLKWFAGRVASAQHVPDEVVVRHLVESLMVEANRLCALAEGVLETAKGDGDGAEAEAGADEVRDDGGAEGGGELPGAGVHDGGHRHDARRAGGAGGRPVREGVAAVGDQGARAARRDLSYFGWLTLVVAVEVQYAARIVVAEVRDAARQERAAREQWARHKAIEGGT